MSKKKNRQERQKDSSRRPSRPAQPHKADYAPRVEKSAAEKERERGLQAFQRGDYSAAIAAWSPLLRNAPSGALERALAEAYFRRSCLSPWRTSAQALDDLQVAVALVPEDPIFLYHMGLAQHRLNNLEQAVNAYRESLLHDPFNYERTAYMLCLAVAETGKDPSQDSAWELLPPSQREKLMPTDSGFAETLKFLAAGKFESAEKPLQRLLDKHGGFAHYYLGVVARRRGEGDEALAHWLCCKPAGFDTPTLRHNLVAAYTERAIAEQESPALLDTVRAGLKLAPDSPVLLVLRQRAEFLAGNRDAAAGNWDNALAHWQAARQGNSNQSIRVPRELMANIALAHENLEHWAEAADTWREIVRRRPRRGENSWSPQHVANLWRHIEALFAKAGQLDKSVSMLRHAIKAQPDDMSLRLALVKRQMENENWKSAQVSILRILETAPNHPEAVALHAQILDMSEDSDAMIEAWQKVLDMNDPRQLFKGLAQRRLAKLYAERGDFYASVKDYPAAVEDYARAVSFEPGDNLAQAKYGAALVPIALDRANAIFEKLDLSQNNAVFAIITALHRAGQHAEAARWLSCAHSKHALPTTLLTDLGAAIFEQHPEQSKAYFARAIDQASSKETPQLLTAIAVLYAEQKKTENAYEYARQALRTNPGYGPAHFNLGLWDAARGRRPAARDHFEKALEWAKHSRQSAISEGIEEAINLLDERYTPTLTEILDTIDPDGENETVRRLLGGMSLSR